MMEWVRRDGYKGEADESTALGIPHKLNESAIFPLEWRFGGKYNIQKL